MAISSCSSPGDSAKHRELKDSLYHSDIIAPYTDSIEQFPSRHDLLFKRGLMLFNDHPDFALENFEAALKLDSDNVDYLAGAGEAALVIPDYPKAVNYFAMANKLAPGYAYLQYKWAIALIEDKQYSAADSVAMYIQQDSVYADKGYYLQARIAEDLGDTARAIQLLKTGIDLVGIKADHEAVLEMGDLLTKKNSLEALQYYQLAFRQDTTDAEPIAAIGDYYSRQKNYGEALKAYERSILIDPTHTFSYIGTGDIYMKEGKYQQALETYHLAIKSAPNEALAFYKRGLAYEKLGNKEAAAADFLKAISFRRDYKEASMALERVKQ